MQLWGLMGIARFDDGIPDNLKFINAGPVASWLWFCGVCYCRRGLTDGFIPKGKVPGLVAGLTKPYSHAATLLAVGLWNPAPGGYQVNDYHDWNPSKADVEHYREKERQRKRGVSGAPSVAESTPESVLDSNADSRLTRAPAGSPLRSAPLDAFGLDLDSEKGKISTAVQPAWNPNGRPRHTSALVGSHTSCYPTPEACARGVCLPSKLGAEWMRQFADPAEGERVIVRVVRDAITSQPDGPIGADPWKFWRAAWTQAHGSDLPSAGQSRSGDTVNAAREYLRQNILPVRGES